MEMDGVIRVKCTWCAAAGKGNAFGTSGSTNLQLSAFTRHEHNPEHLIVVDGRRANVNKQTVPVAIEKQMNATDNDESKRAQMMTMYYLAKHGQPLSQFNNLIDLQIKNQCASLQDKSKIYRSYSTQSEMLDAINTTVEENILRNVNSSDFVGIIIDETTDVSIHKKLNVYFQCLSADSNEPVVHFIDCISIPDGKADTITSEIVNVCNRIGLDFAKVISMASDGASVMTGRHNGVGAKFRSQYNPRLIQIHCVAHRLALAAGQACRDVSSLNNFQTTLKYTYRYFHNSAVRYNVLRAMESVLEDENMKCLALQEPASFRWLSLEAAVTAIMDVYPALVLTLDTQAAKGDAEAKGLLLKIRNISFLFTAAFLQDVLSVLGKLSKAFQRDVISVDVINVMINSTIERLEGLKSDNGRCLHETYEEVNKASGHYKDVKIQDKQGLRIQFQNDSVKYLDILIANLKDRFDEESMGKLQLMNTVLNPACLPATGLNTHGIEELSQLATYLGACDDNHPALVDQGRMKDDYQQFKSTLRQMSGKPVKEVCLDIIKCYGDIFPDFVVLCKLFLVTPVTSVACERGFSSQNRLKTKFRSLLKDETTTKLIRVMEEGPALNDFDPNTAVSHFIKDKVRRK